MVVHADAQRSQGVDDLAGHIDVGGRGRRIAGRVVVQQNEGAGAQLQRTARHLARIDRGVVDGAGAQLLVGDQLVLLVQFVSVSRN